jgi:4-amino-4-deoxychorismate lyase
VSAERLHLPAPPRAAFAAATQAAIAATPELDVVLRLLWIAGRVQDDSTGLVLVSTLPDDLDAQRERGLRLAVLPWSPGALGGVKSTSYAANMLAQDEAVRAGADDALFVSPDGTVLEAPTSNVWFREGEQLLTPSLGLPILAGVTRATLLELAPGLGYAVEEGTYGLDRLRRADEAFLTASIREVMPVVAVDGVAIERGPAAAALQTALRGAAGYPEGQ